MKQISQYYYNKMCIEFSHDEGIKSWNFLLAIEVFWSNDDKYPMITKSVQCTVFFYPLINSRHNIRVLRKLTDSPFEFFRHFIMHWSIDQIHCSIRFFVCDIIVIFWRSESEECKLHSIHPLVVGVKIGVKKAHRDPNKGTKYH